MMDWAIAYREHPVAIRVPLTMHYAEGTMPDAQTDWSKPAYQVAHKGSQVAILGLGEYFHLGEELRKALLAEGVNATLVNPRLITALDTDTLDNLKADHKVVITLEDGQIDGGWGEKIARYYGDSDMRVLVRGERKHFEDRYHVPDLLQANRLTIEQMVEDVQTMLR